MSNKNKLTKDIARTKKRLSSKADRLGLWENFGQDEVRRLENEYNSNSLCYGTPEERKMYNEIREFDKWCMNFTPKNILI